MLSGTLSLNLVGIILQKVIRLLVLGTAFLISSTVSEAVQPATSSYTSIEPSECWVPPAPLIDTYRAQGLKAQECQAPKDFGLFIVSSNERSWIDLMWHDAMWSTEEQIVYKNQFGYFPNIRGGGIVEWRLEDGKPIGLIFRVVAQDPKRMSSPLGQSNTSRLFVISFHDDAVCWRGVTGSNEVARELADSEVLCVEKLPGQK